MKIGKLITKIIVCATCFVACVAVSNIFIFRSATEKFDSFSNVAAHYIDDYLKENNESKTFGSIVSHDYARYETKNFFQGSIGSLSSTKNYGSTNKMFYLSRPTSEFVPMMLNTGIKNYYLTVMVMPQTINNVGNYFGLKMLTKVDEGFNGISSSIIIPKYMADELIITEGLKSGEYPSLLGRKIGTYVTHTDVQFRWNMVIAGVFDSNVSNNKLYNDAFGQYVIAPYNSMLYYYGRMELAFEFGYNIPANAHFISMIEKVVEPNSEYFSWGIYEKNDKNVFETGKIYDMMNESHQYFIDQRGNKKSITYLIVSIVFALLFLISGFYLKKLLSSRENIIKLSKIEIITILFAFGLILSTMCLFSTRGILIDSNIYVPYSGVSQSVISLGYMIVGYLILIILIEFTNNKAQKNPSN